MKTCKNCYWYEQCARKAGRCEDYFPVYGFGRIIQAEYEDSLKERVEEYEDLVAEQQGEDRDRDGF